MILVWAKRGRGGGGGEGVIGQKVLLLAQNVLFLTLLSNTNMLLF